MSYYYEQVKTIRCDLCKSTISTASNEFAVNDAKSYVVIRYDPTNIVHVCDECIQKVMEIYSERMDMQRGSD